MTSRISIAKMEMAGLLFMLAVSADSGCAARSQLAQQSPMPSITQKVDASFSAQSETEQLKEVPASLMVKAKLSGADPHLPDEFKREHAGSVITGRYKLCIGIDGMIRSVRIITPLPGADDPLIVTLSTWRFKPQPEPVCYIQPLEYHISSPTE